MRLLDVVVPEILSLHAKISPQIPLVSDKINLGRKARLQTLKGELCRCFSKWPWLRLTWQTHVMAFNRLPHWRIPWLDVQGK